MAKKAPKKPISKQNFDLMSFKENNGYDITVKEKELTWIPLSDSFHEALKIPGLARGYMTSFRGYSNTGKSTAMYEAVVGCQKIGDLAVIIDTETNWNWEHAKNIGIQFEEIVDEETGEVAEKQIAAGWYCTEDGRTTSVAHWLEEDDFRKNGGVMNHETIESISKRRKPFQILRQALIL